MKIVDDLKSQDVRQKILLITFILALLITAFVFYSSFLKKPGSTARVIEGLAPLNLNLEILESETFNNLKNN